MNRKTVVLVGLCSILPAFIINHIDSEVITYWALELIRHTINGNVANYAVDLYQEGLGTNYSFFLNVLLALWEFPIYAVHAVFQLTEHAVIYETWCKMFLYLCNIFCTYELWKIARMLWGDEEKAYLISYLYLVSPVVQLYSIGMGQVDVIGNCFLLLAIRMYLEEKPERMALVGGMAILCKYFAVLVLLPMILLKVKKNLRTVWCGAILVGIPIIEKVITEFLITDYTVREKELNQTTFLPRLFEVSINGISLVLVITACILYICIYKNMNQKVKKYDWMFFSGMLLVLFFLLVLWHSQWWIYALPILLLLMGCCGYDMDNYLLLLGSNVGFVIHCLHSGGVIITDLNVAESLLGKLWNRNITLLGDWISFPEYTSSVGITIFSACNVLILALVICRQQSGISERDTHVGMGKMLMISQYLPSICYIVLLWAAYLC